MAKIPTNWTANSSALADVYPYDSASHTYDSSVDTYDGVIAGSYDFTTKVPVTYTAVTKNATAWANGNTKNPTPWSNA